MSEHTSRFDRRAFGGNYADEQEPKMRSALERVRDFMLDHIGQWLTKEEIRIGADLPAGTDPTPRIRDLRKSKYGGWTIDQQYRDGRYKYRLMVREDGAIPF